MTALTKSLFFALIFTFSVGAAADAGGSGADSEYSHLPDDFDKAVESIEAEDYSMAIKRLENLQNSRDNDADVLNLLGFTHRKLKDFTLAEQYYKRALAIEPEHKGANEYLGQLYLETDRLEKAEERLRVLKKASFFPNRQYRKLKKAIKAYKNG